MKPDRQAGFTLTELLVVIAIIGILSAMLLGALGESKAAVHRVGCLSNLKQWGVATHLYADDHAGHLPREGAMDGINTWEMAGTANNTDVWYNALADVQRIPTLEYYSRTPSSQQEFYTRAKLFHCPRARFEPIAATYPNFSIAMNSKLMWDFEAWPGTVTPGDFASRSLRNFRINDVKSPVRTALFLDGGLQGESPLSPYQAPFTGQPKAFATQFPRRHRDGGNILFVAGNAESLPGKDVVEMDAESVNRGGAIHPPVKVVWRHDPALVP